MPVNSGGIVPGGGTSSGGGSGVSSFNTRTGAVTLAAGDVEALFNAKGGILVGTGAGTGGELDTTGASNGWALVINSAAASGLAWTNLSTLYMAIATYDPAGIAQQVVGTTATQTITNKRITRRVYAYSAPGATPTINTDSYDQVNMTAIATAITSMTTNLSGTPLDGDLLMLCFTDNGTARAITWGTSFEASTVALPTTTVISTMLTVGFRYNGATSKWRCIGVA